MKPDQLSQTAAFIAVKFYGLTRIDDFHSLFDDSTIRFYDKLVVSLPAPIRYYHYWLRFNWIRKLYIWSEELLLPGDLLHIIARKWIIQQKVSKLVDDDYEQLIVLGGGFDHLGYHFSQKGLSCFEFDAPYMANLKRQFLNDQFSHQQHLQIISSHLPTNNLGSQFEEHPDIDPHKKTIIVAEGFFDYLTSSTVSTLLDQIQNFFSQRPALVSTHFALNELTAFHRWVFTKSVKIVGEQLLFNSSMSDFEKTLSENGFHISQIAGSQEISDKLHQRVKTDLPILKGFYILTAD